MYSIRLVTESGNASIGGPLRTLSEAIAQVDSIAKTIPSSTKLEDKIGIRWSMAGGNFRYLIVTGIFGMPVETEKEQEDL